MLDPKLIKEKPQVIQDMLKARAVEFDLEGLIESDQKRREFIIKTDELRKKKNQVALTISEKRKGWRRYFWNLRRNEKGFRRTYKIRIRTE